MAPQRETAWAGSFADGSRRVKFYNAEIERVTTRYGRLFVATGDSVIGRSLRIYGEWAEDEIDQCAALLADGETIVDVGANIGTHSIALGSRFPNSELVAFEPQPLAFGLLTANILAAQRDNVTARNLGCGETGQMMHVAPDYESVGWNIGGLSLDQASERRPGTWPLALVALDDVVFRRRVQFLKIDVEGMEEAVLAGAMKVIERDRPIIYFELLSIDRLTRPRKLLERLGYDLRWLKSEAFNPRNYRLTPENVWQLGETGILAMPNQDDARVADLPRVRGDEPRVPVIKYSGTVKFAAIELGAQGSPDLSLATTPLSLRNRDKPSDAFGILGVGGWVLGAAQADLAVEVRFAGKVRRLTAAEAVGPLTRERSLPVDFNLLTHLVPDGMHQVEVTVIASDGRRIDFPQLSLAVDNNSKLGRQVAKDLKAFGTAPIVGRVIDSTMFPYQNGTARAWFDADFNDDIPLSLDPSPDAENAQRHLLRWGFCVLHEQLPPKLIANFKRQLKRAIDDGNLAWRAGSSDRIHGAHQKMSAARGVWLYPPVLDFLEDFFKDTPCACQTLTYVNGSEQDAHQDSIHLTPYPSGFMCGVWVALEDVKENSGELFVYPGSHRSGSLRTAALGLAKVEDGDYSQYSVFDRAINALIERESYERLVYRPKAGQILVWHENLIHGGSPRIRQDQTRLSVVSHYFAKGAVGYYDSRGEAAALETLDRDQPARRRAQPSSRKR